MESLQWLRLRLQVLLLLGGKCASKECKWQNDDGSIGCDDIRILQVDHVKGDGREDRIKNNFSTHSLFKSILELTKEEAMSRYQLLCPNCNWLKRYMNKEYRKKAKFYDMSIPESAPVTIPQAHLGLLADIQRLREKK